MFYYFGFYDFRSGQTTTISSSGESSKLPLFYPSPLLLFPESIAINISCLARIN